LSAADGISLCGKVDSAHGGRSLSSKYETGAELRAEGDGKSDH